MSDYKPPFSVTSKMIEQISEISELIGKIKTTANLDKNPVPRRKNRIVINNIKNIKIDVYTL
ncbi:MAG: hypothetical protein ACI4XP_11455 [Acutalibacteraceae bacterium]